ncbi:MAG: hypothetical protein ACOYB4_07390, partial [Methyloceanibacter sp.]
ASERPQLRSIERLIKRPISVVGEVPRDEVPRQSSAPRRNGKSQAERPAPAHRQRRRHYRPAGARA